MATVTRKPSLDRKKSVKEDNDEEQSMQEVQQQEESENTKEAIDPEETVVTFMPLVLEEVADGDDATIKAKEEAFYKLGEAYSLSKNFDDLAALIRLHLRKFLNQISKARGAKLFRTLLDQLFALGKPSQAHIDLSQECIAWLIEEKRAFLRRALEVKLTGLYLSMGQYQAAIALSQNLLKELKKLDDKPVLVEVQLMESKAYFAVSNYPRARAALTTARTTANGIYCPPRMQAALDLQSGIVHAQEGDFKTSYSYFYESFEGYDSVEESALAVLALKYMLLTKILLGLASDVAAIIGGKFALKYAGKEMEAMQSVATASINRSLAEYESCLSKYKQELEDDLIVRVHLRDMYDTLLQQNLTRIVEPYSRVQIDYVAQTIKLPRAEVEAKLSQMILDKTIAGVLDQEQGCLEVFPPVENNKMMESLIKTLQQTGGVVDALSKRAQKLLA